MLFFFRCSSYARSRTELLELFFSQPTAQATNQQAKREEKAFEEEQQQEEAHKTSHSFSHTHSPPILMLHSVWTDWRQPISLAQDIESNLSLSLTHSHSKAFFAAIFSV